PRSTGSPLPPPPRRAGRPPTPAPCPPRTRGSTRTAHAPDSASSARARSTWSSSSTFARAITPSSWESARTSVCGSWTSSPPPARHSPCRPRPTTAPATVSTPSAPAPRPPKSVACVPRASSRCPSFRSRTDRERSLLRGLVEGHGQRLRVGDLDQVTDLDLVQILRVLRLDRLGIALGPFDGDGVCRLVDVGDGGGHGDLPSDGAGRR